MERLSKVTAFFNGVLMKNKVFLEGMRDGLPIGLGYFAVAFSLGIVAETKIFGIPSILCGLDYLILAKGGTVIMDDDNPITLAEEAIKILKNYTYRKILGTEARRSKRNDSPSFKFKNC